MIVRLQPCVIGVSILLVLAGCLTPRSVVVSPAIVDRDITVMLDPGHGGSDDGAYSYTGVPEKSFNDSLCVSVALALLRKGFRVVYTRHPADDVYLRPVDRAHKANREHVDLYISLHHNQDLRSRETRGYSVFYSSYRPDLDISGLYLTVAGSVYEDFVGEATLDGLTHAFYLNQGELNVVTLSTAEFFVYDRTPSAVASESAAVAEAVAQRFETLGFVEPYVAGAVEEKDFIVIRRTTVPSVMIEAGYISNPIEEEVLADPANREAMAEAIAGAVYEYFSIQRIAVDY